MMQNQLLKKVSPLTEFAVFTLARQNPEKLYAGFLYIANRKEKIKNRM